MMFKRKTLAAMILAAGAMNANAIQVDTENRGQLLLSPIYAAGEGQETQIRVVNPDLETAVKAHVTLRSAENSLDLLDFNVYLSPGDEWVGTIKTEGGKVVLHSDDDSMLIGYTDILGGRALTPATGVFADSKDGGHTQPLFKTEFEDSQHIGHIEILGVYAVKDVSAATTTNSVIKQGMSKEVLFDIDNVVYGQTDGNTVELDNVNKGGLYDGYLPVAVAAQAAGGDCAADYYTNSVDVVPEDLDKDGELDGTPEAYCVSATANDIQLFGEVITRLNPATTAFQYQMVALDDSDAADSTTGVIVNPQFDSVAEVDLPLGVRFGAGAADNIADINAAIATTQFTGMYDSMEPSPNNLDESIPEGEGESLLVITFPTKYRHLPANSPDDVTAADEGVFGRLDAGVDADTLAKFTTDNPTLTAAEVRALAIASVNDNGSSNRNLSADPIPAGPHYDYDYGYRKQLADMLDAFDEQTGTFGNHNANDNFIFGTRDTTCDFTQKVQYEFTSFDTEEKNFTPADEFVTDVFSGGIGSGVTTVIEGLSQEVNLVTDNLGGTSPNALWFSTKGWYQLTLEDYCDTDADDAADAPAPALVMTMTTDTNGNSRIVPALKD